MVGPAPNPPAGPRDDAAAAAEPARRRPRRRPLGVHAEVALVTAALLLLGVALGDWFAFFALTPSPLLVPVLWGALRGGLLPALTATALVTALHLLGALSAAGPDLGALADGAVTWPVLAFAAVAYVVGQTRDLLALRIARLQQRREHLQAEASRQRHDIEVLEHANTELQRRIFDRSFDLDSLVATVARSSFDQDEHMFDAPLGMLTDFCGATKCSVLLVLADGTLDLAAHRGWGDAEIGPRLAAANSNTRIMRAIVEAQPVVELADDGDVGGPLLISPIADGTGAIKALVCIDELPPSRFEENSVKTFLGIASWFATNLRRIQMREATSENRQEMMLALDKKKHIGSMVELSERIYLEDARRKRYGVDTELVAIRLLDMRVTMEDYIESLETRLIHVLNTTTRVTDDVFSFGFAGCYLLLLTGCKPDHTEELVRRLGERFAACEGPDFGPVELRYFALTTESPTLADLLLPVTEHFCGTSPIPLAQQCPVPEPRPQRGGNAEAFARRLRLEANIAQRMGVELNMIDFRREGPGFGVGPMIARHLWNSVGTLLRVTDGIYVVNPNRCVVLLPFTNCLDASTIWSRLDESLRASLPQDHYDGVRCDFLALDSKNLHDTVQYLVGPVAGGLQRGSTASVLTENELQELAFSEEELSDFAGEGSGDELERDFQVIATSGADVPRLPSPQEVTKRWEEVFGSSDTEVGMPEPDASDDAAADGIHDEARPSPELEPRVIVMSDAGVPRVPDADAMRRRWDELFEESDEAEEGEGRERREEDDVNTDEPNKGDFGDGVDDARAGGIDDREDVAVKVLVPAEDAEDAEDVAEDVEAEAQPPATLPTAPPELHAEPAAAGPAAMPAVEPAVAAPDADADAPAERAPDPAAWGADVTALVAELARGGEPFTSADVRRIAKERGLGAPGHPNAWGAVMTAASRRGLIEKTGRHVKSDVAGRHSARVAEWVGSAPPPPVAEPAPEPAGRATPDIVETTELGAAGLAELLAEIAELRARIASADPEAGPEAAVAGGGWRAGVDAVVADLAGSGVAFTSADVRALAAERGLGDPDHPNAWGAVMTAAKKRGQIEKTGRYVGSAAAGRHSAAIAEWRGHAEQPVAPPAASDEAVPAESLTVDSDTLQQLRRQVEEVHALLAGAEAEPAPPAPERPAPDPHASEHETLRLLRNQIEGLFALCLRHAGPAHREVRRE